MKKSTVSSVRCEAGDIDVNALAFKAGRLTIEEGGLEGADEKNGGKIRVKPGLALERFRFTIAHETGHYRLHSGGFVDRTDSGNICD
jgi:Zn-dependent peptidase ImmA (M78 family)